MKFNGGICLLGIFTMLASLLTVAILVCVNIINAENSPPFSENSTSFPEISTEYPILIPKNTHKYPNLVEFVELQNESSVDWENGFKKCGSPVEGCPNPSADSSSNVTENQNASVAGFSTEHLQDFKEQPSLCRCDDECLRYGDCCTSVLANLKKIPKDIPWRCVRLLNSRHSVRMISKCPANYPEDDVNKRLCENKDPDCPTKESFSGYVSHYCPSLDVPVYNNKTGNLYKSIFCARCHYVPYLDILPMNHEIRCTSNFTSWADFEDFSLRSTYQRGKLRWDDPNNSSVHCTLYINQLQPEVIKSVVPNVRFCYTDAKEECSLDLNSEENLITYNLCFSYTLVVLLQKGYMFEWYKNPHCAKCDNQSIDIKRTPQCHRPTPRVGVPALGTRLFSGEAGPVGINILFHFSLDMDDGYVGYTSKCEEDEILDFIRNKCVPVICQRGYELSNGQCEKILTNDSASNDTPDTTVPLPNDTNSSDLTDSSNSSSEPCFLIIFHIGEYHQLANGSLAVNRSGNSGILLFQPGEYQKYEGDEGNISMSICAKHVDKTFESSFAPALSYISNILLVVSVLCSVVHVLLYIILPKMRNLPGNNLLCLTSCLLISHFIFLTFINTSNRTVCVVASMSMHYFLLSGFVWMYVMSFDIWRTFSSEFIVRRYSGDSGKTFIKYSLFAWILPLLIVTLAALTDFAMPDSWLEDPEFGPLMKKLRPLYGHNNLCWIGQRLSLFVFFAFPVGLIILCNLILFALTAVTIWVQNKEGSRFINGNSTSPNSSNKSKKHERITNANGVNKIPLHASNSGSTKKSEKIRFKLYLKLALIMGLTWILGILSGFAEWEWLWYPFVIFNGLQGTFIFVAFDCKAKIWNMVKERCGWRKKKMRNNFSGEEGSSESRGRHTRTTTLSSILSSSSGKSGELTASNSEKVLVK